MMPLPCPGVTANGTLVPSMLGYIDCQAQGLGQYGYQALASPASSISPLLTAALTIFIALIGYRLLLGDAPGLRDGVIAAVKVGAMLLLATSWPAVHVLAYDVVMHGPADLASEVGAPLALPGSAGGLVERLQTVDDELSSLARLGAGAATPPSSTGQLTPEQRDQADRAQVASDRPWDPVRDANLFTNARTAFLVGAIGGFAVVRLIAGLLLALTPLFALFLLFDATRGLFEGWMRGLVGAGLGAVAVSIVLGLELGVLEPWLVNVLAVRHAGLPTPDIAAQIFAATAVFGLVLVAALGATAWIARGISFPTAMQGKILAPLRHGLGAAPQAQVSAATLRPDQARMEERSRALVIADALSAAQRREAGRASAPANQIPFKLSGSSMGAGAPRTAEPSSSRRRAHGRVSGAARRRDRIG